MTVQDISNSGLVVSYSLLILPLGIILWSKLPLLNQALIALLRMTVQLIFVGLYLQIVFQQNNFLLTTAWLLIMIIVADFSISRSAGLTLRRFVLPLFIALFVGTLIPLFFFLGPILNRPQLMDAQYAIPIGGMILGNCLRANIIGIRTFYFRVRDNQKAFRQSLAQGAQLSEATAPFLGEAFQASLSPTIAAIATIGLVSLPGMMTGVILGGADPMVAIKYQIAIMIAILTGTTLTVVLGITLTMKSCFTPYGTLDTKIFRN